MSDRPAHPFRWPLSIDAAWLAMPIFVVAIRTLLQPIPMEDYWWHLVMGRLIDATQQIPTTNAYLYTLPTDAPFYDQPWLAQWLMFHIATALGHVGSVLVHTTLAVVTWALLVAAAFRRGASAVAAGVGGALAYFVSASTLMPRTQMFAYPLFVVAVLALLELARRRPSDLRQATWPLLLLGVVTAFWANAHGSFVLAPILTGAAAIGAAVQAHRSGAPLVRGEVAVWAAACTTVALAGAISPGGLYNLWYPLDIVLTTKGHGAAVLEWSAPTADSLPGVVFYVCAAMSVYVLVRTRATINWVELAILTPTLLIALTSVRGILWWALAAVLVVAPRVTSMRARPPTAAPRPAEAAFNAGLLGAMVVAVALTIPGGPIFRAVDPAAIFGDGRLGAEGDLAVLSELHPAGLVQALRDRPAQRVFHHQAVGGFLEWMLTEPAHPAPVAFIDQRLELLPAELWEEYFAISRTKGDWESLVDRHELRLFLVHPDEQAHLLAFLRSSPEHVLIAEDRMWALFGTR